jgi:MYXO-CTERM domain-containing protein
MTTPPSPGIAYWLAILAAVLGFALVRRRAEHLPVALFLGAMAAR